MPTSPSGFQSTYQTCVGVTLQWQPGFSGGPTQTFTITYTDLDTGQIYSVDGIEDTGEDLMKYKWIKSGGIMASKKFRFSITTTNRIGTAPVAAHMGFDASTPGI